MPAAGRGLGTTGSRPPRDQLASRLGWLVLLRLVLLTVLFGLTASFYLRSGFGVGTYSNRVLLIALALIEQDQRQRIRQRQGAQLAGRRLSGEQMATLDRALKPCVCCPLRRHRVSAAGATAYLLIVRRGRGCY